MCKPAETHSISTVIHQEVCEGLNFITLVSLQLKWFSHLLGVIF